MVGAPASSLVPSSQMEGIAGVAPGTAQTAVRWVWGPFLALPSGLIKHPTLGRQATSSLHLGFLA